MSDDEGGGSTAAAPAPAAAKDAENPFPQQARKNSRVTFSGVADSGGSASPAFTQRSLPPRKKSFVDRTAKFSEDVASKERDGYMDRLLKDKRKSMRRLFPDQLDSFTEEEEDEDEETGAADLTKSMVVSNQKMDIEAQSEFVQSLQGLFGSIGGVEAMEPLPALEVRLKNFSFKVPSLATNGTGTGGIATVATPLYKLKAKLKKFFLYHERERKEKFVTSVLSNVNLVLKPRKMYLVLGPPQSGKTSLLKAIGGSLPQGDFPSGYKEKKFLTGQVLYNNLVCCGEGAVSSNELFKNLVAFVNQNDTHAPRLTVGETFVFSGCCKDESIRLNRKGTSENGKVGLTLKGLGLSHVKDTFVGNEQIRGVSGGQRRRVTLGEMLVFDTPLLCGDEISTGLDTASTVDILRILSFTNRLFNKISVVSLLQPSPEAVSMFDDIILLSEGHVIYAGPTRNAGGYFRNLGYRQPDSMDDADYLLAVASTDRKLLATGETHSAEMLAAVYGKSEQHAKIMGEQDKEWDNNWVVTGDKDIPSRFMREYQNPFWIGVWLNLMRCFVLWTRDRIFIRASVIKNIAMGLSVGFVFLNTTLDSSYFGVLFQGNLFIMLGAMTAAPEKVNARAVFYKHADSNFYSSLSYVIGEALAAMPQMLIDVLLFGTFVYWMVGFVASASSFIIYLLLFFLFTFSMGQTMGLLASVSPTKTLVQGGGAVVLLMNVLFSGYIVSPNVIPIYFNWIYWITPLSWIYRALLLNEFGKRSDGEQVMDSYGFVLPDGTPYGREWVGYGFAYIIPYTLVCLFASAFYLHRFRMEAKQGGTSGIAKEKDHVEEEVSESETNSFTDASFVPVDLSFSDLCYDVKASKGSDRLRLLNNVSGVFSSGRLCALMGESGAGKTTLMDVIALRKGGGEISGEVLLNGFPQQKVSFRRCSGYVEQFDVQSAELTVRETIRFSAELRLDRTHPVRETLEGMDQHVEDMIAMLELQNQADVLVGNEEEGGLSFEQKKRLSIAVELAASPSVLFLDEPTSGLDSRAALLVMNSLRKVADTGRTIVATIHQPSSQVFDMFDDLLLLKKGGEVVFYGETGECSSNLISYFEGLGATPMNMGENPATWMLNVLGEHISVKGESEEVENLNFATAWKQSSNSTDTVKRLTEIAETRDEEMEIKFDSTFPVGWFKRDNLMGNRLVQIYWRSPAYNLARMALSVVIALLLGSMFIPIRDNEFLSEAQITSVLATIFISFIIIGVLSIVSVLPVMLNVRDMFYRHKAAGMLNYWSLGRALGTAEHRFILIASLLFCIVFIPVSGLAQNPDIPLRTRVLSGFVYWGFFTFNSAIYSYIGQLFMCLVRGQGTAMVLASIFIGINNFFSGFIVRPQQMIGNFWVITYMINPGHYIYEGLVTSVFWNDYRTVIVTNASQYFIELTTPGFIGQNSTVHEDGACEVMGDGSFCEVPVNEFVYAFFGQQYGRRNMGRNAIILACILVAVRIFTFLALRNLTYSGK